MVSKALVVIGVSLFLLFISFSASDDPRVYPILNDFYVATSGPTLWTTKTGWGSTNNYCGWYGIKCSTDQTRFAIDLDANALYGTIPNNLGQLGGNITGLELDRNRLIGTIPQSLTNMTNLVLFDLSQNNLTGAIPNGFGALTQLQLFWVLGNLLEGAIPVDLELILAQVVKYQDVLGCRLGGNNFCCPVPTWVPNECGMGCNVTEFCTENKLPLPKLKVSV
jgi:hypothetical protein